MLKKLILLSAIGVFAYFFAPNTITWFGKGIEDYTKEQAILDINAVSSALALFNVENRHYPSTKEGLQALVTNPNPTKYPNYRQYLTNLPPDPWGNPYHYFRIDYSNSNHNAEQFELISFGPDGVKSDDDILLSQLDSTQ